MMSIKLKVAISILVIIQKEALYNPNLVRLSAIINITRNDNSVYIYPNPSSGNTSLWLYAPQFMFLNASTITSNYGLSPTVSNPSCGKGFSFEEYETFVS